MACQHLFGNHPSQICFDWNSACHSAADEGRPQRRALTKGELQRFFDYADDQVAEARRTSNKAWLSMMRDAAAFKVAYAWGLRRRELVMLDLEDFGANPHAPEFGDLGVAYVRWGKANRASPPKRRSALTVFSWSVAVPTEWIATYRGLFDTAADNSALWPSERAARIGSIALGVRFAEYRQALGLPRQIGMHCLRHSYVTHTLIEDGFDPLFVQQQVGHSYASTTPLYTSVSSDLRTQDISMSPRLRDECRYLSFRYWSWTESVPLKRCEDTSYPYTPAPLTPKSCVARVRMVAQAGAGPGPEAQNRLR